MSVSQAALQRWQDLQKGLVVVDDNHCLAESSVYGLMDIPRTSTPCKSQAEVLLLPEALMMNPAVSCCWLEPLMTCGEDPDLSQIISDSTMQVKSADAAMWWPRIQEDINQDVGLEFDLTDVVDPNLVLSLAEEPQTSPPAQQRRCQRLQAWQKDILRTHFQENAYCVPETRDLLASQLGITTKKVMAWYRAERRKFFSKPLLTPKTKTPRSEPKGKATSSSQTTSPTLPSPPSSGYHGKRSRRKNINPQRATTPYEDTSVLEYNVCLVRDDAGVVPVVDSSLPYTQSWMNQTWRYQWTDQNTWQYEAFSVPLTSLIDIPSTGTYDAVGYDTLLPTIVHPAPTYSGASLVSVSTITQPTYAMTLNRGALGTHVTDSGCHVTRCSTV